MKLKTLKDLYNVTDFESDGSWAGCKVKVKDIRQMVIQYIKYYETLNGRMEVKAKDEMQKHFSGKKTGTKSLKWNWDMMSTIACLKHIFDIKDGDI